MKTKLLSVFLALAMVASLGMMSCDKGEKNDPAEETKEIETNAPETAAPETAAPETAAPETAVPETNAPETNAPETNAPETSAPETSAPETSAPETAAPETAAPETAAPETAVPETAAPETSAPETSAPETAAPETAAPETAAPETNAPETNAPETAAPETVAPETSAPETEAPRVYDSYDVTFTLSDVTAKAGDIIHVEIYVEGLVEANAYLLHELAYDSDILEFVELTNLGEAGEKSVFGELSLDQEDVTVAIMLFHPELLNGKVCDIQFRVKNNAEVGKTEVWMESVVKQNSEELDNGVNYGIVTVIE